MMSSLLLSILDLFFPVFPVRPVVNLPPYRMLAK